MQSLHRPTRLKHSHEASNQTDCLITFNPSGELVHIATRKLRIYMRFKRISNTKRQTACG